MPQPDEEWDTALREWDACWAAGDAPTDAMPPAAANRAQQECPKDAAGNGPKDTVGNGADRGGSDCCAGPSASRTPAQIIDPGLVLAKAAPRLLQRTRVAKPPSGAREDPATRRLLEAPTESEGPNSDRNSSSSVGPRAPVLYWQRKVLRAHENPALDVAIAAANALGTSVLVLLTAEQDYPHATARRHRFVLEGMLEVVHELRSRDDNMQVAVHVHRRGHRQHAQISLAWRSQLVVVEEPFCSPWLASFQQLTSSKFNAPVWSVDAENVVPSAAVARGACNRAYLYEKATKALLSAELEMFPLMRQTCKTMNNSVVLPFSPVFESSGDDSGGVADSIDQLVAECDRIDHSVRPVIHTVGGSRYGYARWTHFKQNGGLKTYAKRRNDALDTAGVSRMSAYLNLGMVSPFRLARELAQLRKEYGFAGGVRKYENEFLTWRGISYAYCYHSTVGPNAAQVTSTGEPTLHWLPRWARETLQATSPNQLNMLCTKEQLCECRSPDPVWNNLQSQLAEHGELHNNARMGWGKSVLLWCADPEAALQALLELNNKFALDGHSSPSIGGLLGCMGLFESPQGWRPVTGQVRQKTCKPRYLHYKPEYKRCSQLEFFARPGKRSRILA